MYLINEDSYDLVEDIEHRGLVTNKTKKLYSSIKYKYELEYDHSERYLVFFRCENITDSKYPRKPKKIKTNPL